jgi:hypothetical protein
MKLKTWGGKPINPVLLLLGIGVGFLVLKEQVEKDVEKGLQGAFGEKEEDK